LLGQSITILELSVANQTSVVIDIAIQDLLSEDPTPEARQLIVSNRIVRDAVTGRSADALRSLFVQTPPPRYGYVPCDALIRARLSDSRATPSFFVPLFIYNSGARYADICSVIMIAELVQDRRKRWAYAAYFEMDETKLINIHQPIKDVEKLSRFFAGAAVPPSGSVKLNLQFIPHHSANGVAVTATNLVPGKYDLRFYGIDPKGREVFRTGLTGYPLNEETLLCSFKSGQWTYAAGLADSVLRILRN
jgi:hypothetical protein